MELPRLVSLLGVAVVALALGVAAAVLWRPRRRLAVALLGACLVGVAGGATVAARMAGVGERHEMIRSYGGISESTSDFTADLRHERLSFDGVVYTFRTDAPRDQLFAQLRAAYPSGAIAGDTFAITVGEPQPLAIDRAALVGYLDALGTATHTEDGVIIPTSSGAPLRLTLSDDTLTATFARRIG